MNTRTLGSRPLLAAGLAVSLGIGMLASGQTALAADQAVSTAGPATVGLGMAAPFAVLAGAPAVTNTGPTTITGDIGIDPFPTVAGFPPGQMSGTIHRSDRIALQAKSDLATAYTDAAGRPATATHGTLGGLTLVPGVYTGGGVTLGLTGTLTLDGRNDPGAVWVFQATSDLVTASSSTVRFVNGGQACNVFWQVTSSATLGSGSTFVGTILALTSITMATGVTLDGRALARNGEVTLIDDTITRSTCSAVTPSALITGPTLASSRAPASPDDVRASRGMPIILAVGVAILVFAFAALLGEPDRRRRPATTGMGWRGSFGP